jgi:hypothetical protein
MTTNATLPDFQLAQDRFYVPSDIKTNRRIRRTKHEMAKIRDVIEAILEEDHPQTVRQVFYALTVRGAIKKLEIEYHRTVIRLLVEMREAGRIPFGHIADNTVDAEACNLRGLGFLPQEHSPFLSPRPVGSDAGLRRGLVREGRPCRRSDGETEPYDVPLMVSRGYASLSFLHSAAAAIEAKGKPAYIYHFGDHDPSGVDAARDIEAKLRRYSPASEIHFERVAVTREQIERWNLPTRPTKQTDTRAKKFGSATSVELDAIPARQLRELVRGCVERHIDQAQLSLLRVAEKSERELLTKWAATLRGEAP